MVGSGVLAPERRRGTRDHRAGGRYRIAGPLAGWLVLVAVAIAWGQLLNRRTPLYVGSLPPFSGQLAPRLGPGLGFAIAVAAAVTGCGRAVAARLRWRPLLAVSSVAALGWAAALATIDGAQRLAAPLATRYDYLVTLPALDRGVGEFLRNYVRELPTYSVHTRSHPPGPVLVGWLLDRVGLPGPGWAAGLVIAAGASAVAAVAITVRAVAGEAAARRALPFLVLAPAAVWVATSMDALFLGVAAWTVAALALAARADARRGVVLAIGAGLGFGAVAFLSYGLVPVAALAVAVAWQRPRLLAVAGLAVAAVVATFAAAGFWWPAGVGATHAEWARGHGADRPYGYFLLGNLAVLAVVVGPATAAGFARLRDRRLWLVVGAAALAVVASDLGGFSRGEVERIWLPFAVWLIAATAALPGPARGWLVAQAAVALVITVVLATPW